MKSLLLNLWERALKTFLGLSVWLVLSLLAYWIMGKLERWWDGPSVRIACIQLAALLWLSYYIGVDLWPWKKESRRRIERDWEDKWW